MRHQNDLGPKAFKGVMVSSPFTDLKEHRAALIDIIDGADLKAVVMENDSAKPDVDVLESSLEMVRKASAYIGLISLKYGQTPVCPKRNPDHLSITELEFNEAQALGRPILLFIMGEEHPVRKRDIESNRKKVKQLASFRERAMKMGRDTQVHRVYATFDSLDEFKEKANKSLSELRLRLSERDKSARSASRREGKRRSATDNIPRPPAFYAQPPYIGSHAFVGRRDQLDTLDEWATSADSHPVLLYEAIGGSGKSMLTWEWVRNHAPKVREDWAGRFWYSFYERGAIMTDFCRHALAYMTGRLLKEFATKKTPELARLLLQHLQANPWLLVLDGLERVLVAYNRIDAAQLRDEEAGETDAIAKRDPCAAIRPEDDDLLRLLSTAARSKLLLTSRLVPRVLVNAANNPIPGVLWERLPGLRPADAEALFRACGVSGESGAIQAYLKEHCDCHPLTVGALAGLVTHYLPARGNFDKWDASPKGGGRLDFTNLDLIQKRNHILTTSIAALPEGSRRLLSMIALLPEAVDYKTLTAINPHLPLRLEEVPSPKTPEESWRWPHSTADERRKLQKVYKVDLQRRADYEEAVQAQQRSPEWTAAPKRLDASITDLEKRGLLQYDAQLGHYDLHPVVRGVAAGGVTTEDKQTLGQRAVDYFSARPHNPYEQAERLEDLRDGLHVVRMFMQMGRFEQACDAYFDLHYPLMSNLDAATVAVALLRPFFPDGWEVAPSRLDEYRVTRLAVMASGALRQLRESEANGAAEVALLAALKTKYWWQVGHALYELSIILMDQQNRIAKGRWCSQASLEIARLSGDPTLLTQLIQRFRAYAEAGQWAEADAAYRDIDTTIRQSEPLVTDLCYWRSSLVWAQLWRGTLREEDLAKAEQLARKGRSRLFVRDIHYARGRWRLDQSEWALAAESLHEAVAMAQAVGYRDGNAEAALAIARVHLGQLGDARATAESVASVAYPGDLATLWLAIGDREQAKVHALAGYKLAWGDGQPFVRRYDLDMCQTLLERLGEPIPDLPPYDPSNDEKLPWEDAVVAAIEELRRENAAEAAESAAEDLASPDMTPEQDLILPFVVAADIPADAPFTPKRKTVKKSRRKRASPTAKATPRPRHRTASPTSSSPNRAKKRY